MNPLLKLARRINSSVIARNLVLAACAIIVFVFVVNLLLNLFTRHGQVRVVPDFSHMTVEEAAHAGKEASTTRFTCRPIREESFSNRRRPPAKR